MGKYLVTGGAGFIGSHLVRHILAAGHEVVVLDNFATGKRENMADFIDKVEFVEGDIRDRGTMDRAVAGCAAVFHEAALGSVPRSVDDPATSHDVNVNGTLTVLDAARAAGVKRVIFAGSSAVYGDRPESPKHEGMLPLPISPYAAGKVACECYMRAHASCFGMETLSLRYFNVFGPYQDPEAAYAAVIPAFVSRLLRKQSPIVYGDGEQSRDFCYIDNVCEANWLAAHAPAETCAGEAVNIACNAATSLNEILAELKKLMNIEIDAEYTDPRPGDVKHSLADISLAKKLIGYEPKVFFAEGLKKAIDWYAANL